MVSVCMTTFNGEKYIGPQLKSILYQLGKEDEIIVSDDGSSDNTLQIIKSFNDPRIKIFENSFKNLIVNFEFSLNQAKGEFIFLADQDDIWLPNKIKICKSYLKDFDVIVSDCFIVNQKLEIINNSFFQLNKSKGGIINNLLSNSYLGCCMAFRRKVLVKALPFPRKIPMHDIWLGFVTEMFFNSKFIEEKLVLYRRHGRNESPTGEKSPFSLIKKALFRWRILLNFPSLWRKKIL